MQEPLIISAPGGSLVSVFPWPEPWIHFEGYPSPFPSCGRTWDGRSYGYYYAPNATDVPWPAFTSGPPWTRLPVPAPCAHTLPRPSFRVRPDTMSLPFPALVDFSHPLLPEFLLQLEDQEGLVPLSHATSRTSPLMGLPKEFIISV